MTEWQTPLQGVIYGLRSSVTALSKATDEAERLTDVVVNQAHCIGELSAYRDELEAANKALTAKLAIAYDLISEETHLSAERAEHIVEGLYGSVHS